MSGETQATIGKWARETFPGGDDRSPRHCLRMLEEAFEVCMAAGAHLENIEETMADAAMKWQGKRKKPHGVDYEAFPEPEKVAEELADVAICLDVLAERRGLNLRAEVDRKMARNRARVWKTLADGTGYHAAEPTP